MDSVVEQVEFALLQGELENVEVVLLEVVDGMSEKVLDVAAISQRQTCGCVLVLLRVVNNLSK